MAGEWKVAKWGMSPEELVDRVKCGIRPDLQHAQTLATATRWTDCNRRYYSGKSPR